MNSARSPSNLDQIRNTTPAKSWVLNRILTGAVDEFGYFELKEIPKKFIPWILKFKEKNNNSLLQPSSVALPASGLNIWSAASRTQRMKRFLNRGLSESHL